MRCRVGFVYEGIRVGSVRGADPSRKPVRNENVVPQASVRVQPEPAFTSVQQSTMSPVLPFDITALIIDIVGEDNDADLDRKSVV